MEEIWKPVVGHDGYIVSNLGRVKSLPKMKGCCLVMQPEMTLKNNIAKVGYHRVNMGRRNQKYIHRIVAEAFIPNPQKRRCVNHINGIKTDNRVENLEWCTHKENVQHSYDTGLNPKGIRKNRMVLSLTTGIYYDNCREAADSMGINYNTVMARFRQGYKNNNLILL